MINQILSFLNKQNLVPHHPDLQFFLSSNIKIYYTPSSIYLPSLEYLECFDYQIDNFLIKSADHLYLFDRQNLTRIKGDNRYDHYFISLFKIETFYSLIPLLNVDYQIISLIDKSKKISPKVIEKYADDPKTLAMLETCLIERVEEESLDVQGSRVFPPFKLKTFSPPFSIINEQIGIDQLIYYHKPSSANNWEFVQLNYYSFIEIIKQVEQFNNAPYLIELAPVESAGGLFFGLVENNQIVSAGAMEIISSKIIFLSYACTNPQFLRKGYFKKLIKNLIIYADYIQKDIVLYVENEIAKKIYLSLGFTKKNKYYSDSY